jgi:hypothetical protein
MGARFVFLTCGGQEAYHLQAWYALLSVLAYAPAGVQPVMVTDQPERYRWFQDRVSVLPIDAAQVKAWRGPHDFLWRVKIEAIRAAAAAGGPGPLVYCDTDVVARSGVERLLADLEAGDVFMHRCEAPFGRLKGRTGTPVRRRLPGRSWAGVPAGKRSEMWNAGVVAVKDYALIDRALAVCDAILADGFHHTLVEQASFSLTLATTGRLHAADHAIIHYWGNKPGWEAELSRILAEALVRGLTPAEAVELVRSKPIERPLHIRRRWWNQLFTGLAGAG